MIEPIVGEEGSAEYAAAEYLVECLARQWPGLRQSSAAQECVKVAAGAKISGYKIADIDIVIAASFNDRDRAFIPRGDVRTAEGKVIRGRPVHVRNLVIAVEVKDHDESGVRLSGDKVLVRYGKHGIEWKSATDQNMAQATSLRDYLKDWLRLGDTPYVFRCLVMHGLQSTTAGSTVAGGYSAVDFLSALLGSASVRSSRNGYWLSSTSDAGARAILTAPLFKRVQPTALDRTRMDRIVTGSSDAQRTFDAMGTRLVRLRGHGGTGKTVMLLHAAWHAFEARAWRTAFLTYNHALAADVRRTLTLMRIPANDDRGGIRVQTVMSFMTAWFRRLGIAEGDDWSVLEYEKNCATALELLNGGALSPEDVRARIDEDAELFRFDAVVVDEAQDWPQVEAELLKVLYGASRICLADGIDQLLRDDVPTNWGKGVPDDGQFVIGLSAGLRMKRNLALLLNVVADRAGIRWSITPNPEAGGGKVIVIVRPYADVAGLHDELVSAAQAKGNDEVDFLHCVPSDAVEEVDGERRSRLGIALRERGCEVWDATNEAARRDFPRSKHQFRIVHYESCRGLEGWTVVLHGADRYWAEASERHRRRPRSDTDGMADPEELAAAYAWRRLLIAMTRPIDTLVIELTNRESKFARVMLRAAQACEDFVDVRT